ncbi:MAG: GHKL domain-containing protein [Clostridia bacterium]|nr:GHKL domain-containing protein [Clostridia bacterium]
MLGDAFLKNRDIGNFWVCWPEWLILDLSYAVISSLMDILLFIQLFNIKVSKKKILSIVSVLGIVHFIIFLIVPSPFNKILCFIITFSVAKIFFKQSPEKCALCETLNVVILITVESILAKCLFECFDDVSNYIEGIYNFKFTFCLKISIMIVRALILFVLIKKKVHIFLSNHLNWKSRHSIYIISAIGMLLTILTEFQLLNIKHDILYTVILLNIMLYIYICMQNVLKINMVESQELKIHSLEVYNKTLSIMYDSIRGFKHDFSNFVMALDGYVEAENIDGIRNMSKAILEDCVKVNKMEILDPKIIQNSAIYSIVTNKYYLAKEQSVNMNIEVLTKIEEKCENNYEICRILGILLDNAIEAAKDTENKIINVKFMQDSKVDRKLIIIENSYNNKNIDLDKIFEKGYTSKEDSSKEHGLGLWNIRNILMNNEDLNLYTTANELFRQQLEIY